MSELIACSNCFRDQGLRLEAANIGLEETSACPNCGAMDGRKLNRELLEHLAQ